MDVGRLHVYVITFLDATVVVSIQDGLIVQELFIDQPIPLERVRFVPLDLMPEQYLEKGESDTDSYDSESTIIYYDGPSSP